MLFGKDPTRQMEVFNDADGSLINIYRCIKYHPEAVAAELALLPDSREVFFDSAAQTDCRGLTDIQRAARSLYLIKMSFGCDRRTLRLRLRLQATFLHLLRPYKSGCERL